MAMEIVRSTQVYNNYGHLQYQIQLIFIYHSSSKRRRGNETLREFLLHF